MGTIEQPQVDVAHYTYRVSWSPEDHEFVATVVEFPSLSWLDATQVEALQGLERLVQDVVDDLVASGEEVPEPIVDKSYSGKFNLRLGENLHREVALRAAEANISINQWVVRKLIDAS